MTAPTPDPLEEPLFGGYEPAQPLPVPDLSHLSAGQRLTLRQRADVDRGIHPLTGEPAAAELGTCGDCRFRNHYGGYPKCDRPAPPAVRRNLHSRSATTDVRAWWPACPAHQPKETP